jgi:2-iminobutanoate/2-iminopropanoate deaminase
VRDPLNWRWTTPEPPRPHRRSVRSFAEPVLSEAEGLRKTLRFCTASFVIPSEVEESLIVAIHFAATIAPMKKIISTNEAPGAIGPYSQAVRNASFLFCSGQIPLDPKSGQIVPGDIAAQTRRVLDNIAAILKAEGLSFDHVVKTTIFLTNLGDFQTVNEIYGSYFKQDPPARSTVQVAALPKGANVEIEVIAMAGDAGQTAYDTSG